MLNGLAGLEGIDWHGVLLSSSENQPCTRALLRPAVERFVDDVARPIPSTRALAEQAALVRARHQRRRDRDVSLADCFGIATALPDAEVATSDTAIASVARVEGLGVIALPNPRGRWP